MKLDPSARGRAEEVATRIRAALVQKAPDGLGLLAKQDVQVLTYENLMKKEMRYWLFGKSIGLIFLFGVVVALIVGLVVVYQVLSSDITDHFREYATLKAMGYSNRYLASVVLQQALILAVFGYVPALLIAWLGYRLIYLGTKLPVVMLPWLAGLVFVGSALMCVGAALLSVRKVTKSDPASLF